MNNILITFPILMYSEVLTSDNIIQQSITDFLNHNKVERVDCWPENIKTTFTYAGDEQVIRKYPLAQKYIEQKAHQYCAEAFEQYHEFSLNNSWLNIFEQNDYQFDHDHRGLYSSNVTFVYYYNAVDEGGEIVFRNPHQYTSSTFTAFEAYNIKPQPYQLIMFPCFILHRVNPNKTTTPRISLAGNLNVKFSITDLIEHRMYENS